MNTLGYSLILTFKVYICFITYTNGEYIKKPCTLTIQDNSTLFEKLPKYYDKEGTVIIVEYTLKFDKVSANFSLSRQSDRNAYMPDKWYSTQGIGASRLLLTYDFLYGAMKYVLYYCSKEEELILNVDPPDCLDTVKNENLENFIRDFLLKELNIGTSRVDDLFFCSAVIGANNDYGRLLYRCCTYNSVQKLYCEDVTENDDVTVLHIFLTILTITITIYFHAKMSNDLRYQTYEFTMPRDVDIFIKLEVKKNIFNDLSDLKDSTEDSTTERRTTESRDSAMEMLALTGATQSLGSQPDSNSSTVNNAGKENLDGTDTTANQRLLQEELENTNDSININIRDHNFNYEESSFKITIT